MTLSINTSISLRVTFNCIASIFKSMASNLSVETVVRKAKRTVLPLLSRLAEAEHSLRTDEPQKTLPAFTGVFPSVYCSTNIFFGNLLELFIELNARFSEGAKMLPVRFSFFGKSAVFVTNPKHIHQIFNDPGFSRTSQPELLARLRQFLGFNLVTVEDELWPAHRPRVAAYFVGQHLANHGQVMREVMEEYVLPQWRKAAREHKPIDIMESMVGFSSRVAFRAFMELSSSEVPDELHPALNRFFSHVRVKTLTPGLPLWAPTAENLSFKRDRDLLRNFIRPYLEKRKASENLLGNIIRAHTKRTGVPPVQRLADTLERCFVAPTGDTLAADRAKLVTAISLVLQNAAPNEQVFNIVKDLIKAANTWAKEINRQPKGVPPQAELESLLCEGGEWDEELIMQETSSMLIGGSETTILLMAWGLYHLGRTPEVFAKLHQEAAADTEHDVPIIDPTMIKGKWSYIYNILKETLRLNGPAAVFNRPAVKDISFDGFEVKAGTMVWGSQYVTQRSPYVWKEPDRFMPERWDSPVPPGAFFPFTLGQRMCVGNNFAYLEAAIVMVTLAKHFNIELVTKDIGWEMGLTLRPDRPVELLLHERPR